MTNKKLKYKILVQIQNGLLKFYDIPEDKDWEEFIKEKGLKGQFIMTNGETKEEIIKKMTEKGIIKQK